MHRIRMAVSRGYSLGWVNYDEQYRLRKATSPTSSWGVVDMELWMLYMSTPLPPPCPRAISVLTMSKDNPTIFLPPPPIKQQQKIR